MSTVASMATIDTLEEVYGIVQFALKSLHSSDNIDDQVNLHHITKILQFFHIDAWLITRSNILLPSEDNEIQNKDHCVVMCFEGTSVLFVNPTSKIVTYFNPKNDNNSVPRLIERFVNRTYPGHDVNCVVLAKIKHQHDQNDNQQCWIMVSWFVTIVSKYNKSNVVGSQLQQLLDKEYEDIKFLLNFHNICWDIVSATRKKHVHTRYSVSKASLYAVLNILHQVVKCFCKTVIDDEKKRKEIFTFDATTHSCVNMSSTLSYDKLMTCWDRLNKWSQLHSGDVTFIKNANIELSNIILVHYKYLIKYVTHHAIVNDYNNKINTIMDMRDSIDDLITRTII